MSRTNGVAAADPDLLEHQVQHLRDECARLLHELEGRYRRVARIPDAMRGGYQRLREGLRRLEHAMLRLAHDRAAVLVAGSLVAGVAVALLLQGRDRRAGARLLPRLLGRRSRSLGARMFDLLAD